MALTGATLGKTVMVNEDVGTVFQNYRVGKFVLKHDELIPEFLFYLLQSTFLMSQVFDQINQSAIGNIGKDDFENTHIVFPQDKIIQKEIIKKIKNAEEKFKEQKTPFENIKQNYESRIKYINHIKSSILSSAFSGKLVN